MQDQIGEVLLDIMDELAMLSRDVGCLAKAYRRKGEDTSRILRMLASKWEHVAKLFRQQADELDAEVREEVQRHT